MDNLGVAMNATTIEAYALSKGINESYNEMDNATKIGLAMEMFLEKTAYAEGNYAKENETFAGSFSTLKASIENFLSGAGDVDAVIDSVMSFGEILIKSISEMAPKMVQGIIKLINGIVPQIPKLLQQLLPVVINGSVELIQGLVQSLPTILPILMEGIVLAFSGISEILPELIQAVTQATIYIINALANSMPVLMPQLINAILEIIPILLRNLPLFIDAGKQLLLGIGKGLLNALPNLMSTVGNIASSILNKFKKLFGIHSPSRVMRDQVGKFLAQGLGVGFDNELDDVYNDMQRAINLEQAKLQANVETGKVFNSLQNSTPFVLNINADVEMDSQKVGRIVTPVVTKTIKTGGGV